MLKKRCKIMYIVLLVIAGLVLFVVGYMNHPKFGRLPRGERLSRIEKSPNYHGGIFHNLQQTPQITSDKGRFRTMFDFLFEKRVRNRPEHNLPAVKTDFSTLPAEGELLVWFGHSSYFIQSGGKRMLIDPVFESASPVSFFNKPFKGTDIYKAEDMPAIDYLIITHDHWDHLDYETVKKLKNRVSRVICPLGVGEYFEQWGFDTSTVVEMDWNEHIKLSDSTDIYCLPSRHFSGRTFKSNHTLWASFMIQTPEKSIYISGDGGYGTHFSEIAKRFPHIDVAIMENGQYNQDWRYIHFMPEDLVKAIEELNPYRIFTGHNSKYALSKHEWDEPMNNIASAAEKKSFHLIMPVIGEVVGLNDTIQPVNKWWLK